MSEHRYPLGPFLALTGWTMHQVTKVAPCGGEEYRARLERGVTERMADRLATAAGYHPLEVWPELVDRVLVACAADDCTARFVPSQSTQRYCSQSCSSRHRRRIRYHQDPDYRARRRAQSAAYYEENGDYVRRRNLAAKHMYRSRQESTAA